MSTGATQGTDWDTSPTVPCCAYSEAISKCPGITNKEVARHDAIHAANETLPISPPTRETEWMTSQPLQEEERDLASSP